MMQSVPPATITSWQQGDEQAVRAVFNLCYPQAVRLAVLSGLSTDAAQDCAQEAFLHAFERRLQLRDPVAFPLWFHRIVTRHILDACRGKQNAREAPLEAADKLYEDWRRYQPQQPDEVVISAEEYSQIWQNVQLLPPLYRVPLVLRYYGDFSLHEVAKLMGKREGTIRVTIHRALQQLRTLSQQVQPVQAQRNQPISFVPQIDVSKY
jgi:RNA polymerase sigma-70 factor, ECF subfamily